MTKEELEKKAEVCMHNALFWLKLPISKENVEQGGSYILKLLEPREKQIQIDAEQIRALQKQNGELTDELTKKSDTNHQLVEQMAELNEKCSELEAQIEKMKCCGNCVVGDKACYVRTQEHVNICPSWKLKEIKEK